MLLNPNRDYDAAVKQVCRFCEHFLVNGPDIDPETRTRDKFSVAATASSLGFDIGFEKNGHKIDFWVLNGNLEEEKLMY